MWAKNGVRREMGWGRYPIISLSKARDKAQVQRQIVADGGDLLVFRNKARTTEKVTTFGETADHLVEILKSDWTNQKHRQQWKRTISHYCSSMRDIPVKDIDTDDFLKTLKPVWTTKEVC